MSTVLKTSCENMGFRVVIPKLRTYSEQNLSRWQAQKIHKSQKLMVKAYLSHCEEPKEFPVVITVTRIAPRFLDEHDNLRMSLKYIVDAISEWITKETKAGRSDDDKNFIWQYGQKKGKVGEYSVEISITKKI